MRLWLGLAAALLQLLVLGFMAGQREFVLRTGTQVHLRSAPLDPRDLFRGDYVRLAYEASNLPKALWRDGLLTATPRRDALVYVRLRQDESGPAEVEAVTDRRPPEGLFIRGRVAHAGAQTLRLRYGLEAYFMQQGKALELEHQRQRDGIQVPLDMTIAVGRGGLAVIRGHRWADLGIGIDLEVHPPVDAVPPAQARTPARADTAREFTGIVKVRLLNAGERPLALIEPPSGRSFRLVPDAQWQDTPWQWVNAQTPVPAATAAEIRVVAPGEVYETRLDLTQPQWFVTGPDQAEPRTVRGLDDWRAWFRLVYAPPALATGTEPPAGASLWQGALPSRRFTGTRRID